MSSLLYYLSECCGVDAAGAVHHPLAAVKVTLEAAAQHLHSTHVINV